MKILIVSATDFEIAPFEKRLAELTVDHDIDFLKTGVGPVPTCFYLSQYLLKQTADLVINAGIAGAFDVNKFPLGTVLEIQKDRFGDLGAEFSDGHFEDVFDLGLEKDAAFYKDGWLINPNCGQAFQTATGLTMHKVTGTNEGAAKIYQKYHADTESMEGAAVAYTCQQLNIPYRQIRSISNKIENRDRDKWNIPLAINNLNAEIFRFIENL